MFEKSQVLLLKNCFNPEIFSHQLINNHDLWPQHNNINRKYFPSVNPYVCACVISHHGAGDVKMKGET